MVAETATAAVGIPLYYSNAVNENTQKANVLIYQLGSHVYSFVLPLLTIHLEFLVSVFADSLMLDYNNLAVALISPNNELY